MRKVIGWLSRNRSSREVRPVLRRRIDLGENPAPYPIYAIGDVHGCLDLLKQAEARIAADISASRRSGLVVLLGDYIDRGPQSRQVIEHLIDTSELGLKRLPLCGNHDDLFVKFLDDPEQHSSWLNLGGEQTLVSYGIDIHGQEFRRNGRSGSLKAMLAEAIPVEHRRFFASLPICLKIGDLFFVHAGIRPGVALESQVDEDLMWIREPFLAKGPKLPHLFVIHGHTPHPEPFPGPQRVGIDTGAFYSGTLTVIKFDGGETHFI